MNSNTKVSEKNTDFEMRSLDAECINKSELTKPWHTNIKYILFGTFFGIVLVKAEVVSWFRIQEMFRFEAFHMYGVIGTAVCVGALSVFLIKKFNIKTIEGEEIKFSKKEINKGQVIGGLMFGLGWAITGACPGPIFAQIGYGYSVVLITLLSAIAGTWTYGKFRDKLPH